MMLPDSASIDADVRRLFVTYCSFGDVSNVSKLSCAKFSKLIRDAGLLGSSVASTEVDLIFARRSRTPRLNGGTTSCSTKKALSYPSFLAALTELAEKRGAHRPSATAAKGGSRLVMLLLEHILPLATRAAPAGGTLCGGTLTDRTDGGALGEEELLARCSLLEVIFGHYCRTVHIDPAAAEAEAAVFWEAIRQERAMLAAHGLETAAAAAGEAERASTATTRGNTAVVDLAAWQRFAGHFTLCPNLLSIAELGRLFQLEAARAPPTGLLSFAQFAHALGATAAAAFPPPLGSRSFDDGGTQSVRELFSAMKLDDARVVQQRLALSGRRIAGLADAIAHSKARLRPTQPTPHAPSLPTLTPALLSGMVLPLLASPNALAPSSGALYPGAYPPKPTPPPPRLFGGAVTVGGSIGLPADMAPGVAGGTPPALGQLTPRADQIASRLSPAAQRATPEAGGVAGAHAVPAASPRLPTPLPPAMSTDALQQHMALLRSSFATASPSFPLPQSSPLSLPPPAPSSALQSPPPPPPPPPQPPPLPQPTAHQTRTLLGGASGFTSDMPPSRSSLSPQNHVNRACALSGGLALQGALGAQLVGSCYAGGGGSSPCHRSLVASSSATGSGDLPRAPAPPPLLVSPPRSIATISTEAAAAATADYMAAAASAAALATAVAVAAEAFEVEGGATALDEQEAEADEQLDERAEELAKTPAKTKAQAEAEALAREQALAQKRNRVLAAHMAAAAAATAKQEAVLMAIEARCAGATDAQFRACPARRPSLRPCRRLWPSAVRLPR